MTTAPELPDDEVARLRRCLNDLVGVTALPALWTGAEPSRVVSTLLDALGETLQLAFAYVRLSGDADDPGLEMIRLASESTFGAAIASPRDVGAMLERSLGPEPAAWAAQASIAIEGRALQVAVARLGLHGETGVVVAASERGGFPVQTERLLLDVTANQAALGLQQARLLNEQRRVADRLENALGVSERDSRLIVDSIPGMVALLGPAGSVEVVNRQLLEYFGQPFDALQRWSMTDVVHPDDLPHVIDVFSGSMAAGTPYEILQRFRRADGVYRWFQNNGYPVRGPDGRVMRWCVLLTDVDDRQRAADAVRESERELKLVTDTIPALVWSTTADGRADFFNQSYLQFIGFTAEQASGWGWTTAVHPDDLPGLTSTWQGILGSRERGEAEARLRRHDGTYRWFLFRASPLRDTAGDVVRWYGVNTDIEDRKQAEDAVRRSEAFLLDIQRLSHIGSWRYDVATGAVDNSPEMHRAFGTAFDSPVTHATQWIAMIHPEDRAYVEEVFGRCLRERTPYRAAYRVVRSDGTIGYHEATGHPVVNDAGELVEYVGAGLDMTEHWRARMELQRASETLRELQAELSRAAQVATMAELAASIAHEVNQPLTGIITNANTCLRMLSADPPNVDGARETARGALRDGGRAADVVERLRRLFGNKDIAFDSLDLNDATREVVALSTADLQRNRVLLSLELGDDLPPVAGDRVQLQQVILNLVRNASDAMSEVADRPRELRIRTERDGGEGVRVSVRDTGIGVDPRTAAQLFDPFHTTKRDGMGIGLSVSRSIVRRHRGRLWVEPNAGPGATFVFTVPAAARLPDATPGNTNV